MPKVTIHDRGCRGCELCVDHCPVDVFERDDANERAVVARTEDCMGCLSCYYICPSRCIEVTENEELRPFHRIEQHQALVERFLQGQTATNTLSEADYTEAWDDVAARLHALAGAVVECMGRGYRAVGRRAGGVAAAHLPEMYEEKGIEDVLHRMKELFQHTFAFDYEVNDEAVDLTFSPCGLCQVVEDAGEKVGDAVLCTLFHEYWSGLFTVFAGKSYRWELPEAGKTCKMILTPR